MIEAEGNVVSALGLPLSMAALLWSGTLFAAVSPELLLRLSPSCLFRLLTGLNCPFCGMTRDLISLVHGRFEFLNPASPALFLCLLFVYPGAALLALHRRQPLRLQVDERCIAIFLTVLFCPE